jgi:hypothetical protein
MFPPLFLWALRSRRRVREREAADQLPSLLAVCADPLEEQRSQPAAPTSCHSQADASWWVMTVSGCAHWRARLQS